MHNAMDDFCWDKGMNSTRITRKMVDSITFSSSVNMSSTLEDSQVDETNGQGVQVTINIGNGTKQQAKNIVKKRRFSGDVEIVVIPRIKPEEYDDLYYTEDEIAEFRHDAFMESCGLSNDDFHFDLEDV
jgi:hypothetical protein